MYASLCLLSGKNGCDRYLSATVSSFADFQVKSSTNRLITLLHGPPLLHRQHFRENAWSACPSIRCQWPCTKVRAWTKSAPLYLPFQDRLLQHRCSEYHNKVFLLRRRMGFHLHAQAGRDGRRILMRASRYFQFYPASPNHPKASTLSFQNIVTSNQIQTCAYNTVCTYMRNYPYMLYLYIYIYVYHIYIYHISCICNNYIS